MPRNGDRSGDSGPYEGHDIVHGATGDETLQHTKKVALMPDVEDGDALPGMNASGGAAAPLAGDSEEYGANEPKRASHLDNKFESLNEDEVNIASASSKEDARDARAQRRADALDQSRSKGSDEAARFGGHADVEELHGQATLEDDKSKQ